jgi:hypothetical protein
MMIFRISKQPALCSLCPLKMFPKPLNIALIVPGNTLRDVMFFIELVHPFLVTGNYVKHKALGYGQLFNQIIICFLFTSS